jgi:hypothetical protein
MQSPEFKPQSHQKEKDSLEYTTHAQQTLNELDNKK